MPEQHSQFATTHWSVVLAAGQSSTQASLMALETLCTTYWYPLYAYIRRRGYAVEESQDLTQEFFTRILEKKVATELNSRQRPVPLLHIDGAESLSCQ